MKRTRVLVKNQRGSVVLGTAAQSENLVAAELRTGMATIGSEVKTAAARVSAAWKRMRERVAIQRKLRRMTRELDYGNRDIDWRREELMKAERNQSALELLYRANEEKLLARLAQLDRGL